MNRFNGTLRIWTAMVLILSMTALNLGTATAGLAPSTRSGETSVSSERDADMLMAQRALEHKVVAQKLRDYGVSADAAQLKLASMSDQDLHHLASASKGLPSGGDGTGAIIGVLIVVILVIVVIRLMHHDVVIR
ncbi:MAG: PA2779 family protein [Candidatus Eisenbacteria bacterium]|uniref:PA2779 family protein n=1 Tax=Eiseniibacteriota bacterium TaxID=2212470 RepID=A0A849SEE4_UNCEI|nr:PA2779 family protein [Candidatus Eisenbacteria bacterium]